MRRTDLRHELLKREKEARNYMLTAARLIAPELKIDGDDSARWRATSSALRVPEAGPRVCDQ